MKHILRLIRFENLLIVVATQYLLRYLLIIPTLENRFSPILEMKVDDQFGELNFFLLVLATVFITAGGFIINDYFDRKTDLVNRPNKVIIGTHISRRKAIIMHYVLNIIGIGLGFYISWKIGFPSFGVIFVLISGLLWFYSTNFNQDFLIGNVIVAVLAGLVPLIVVVYEIVPLNFYYKNALNAYVVDFNELALWIVGYAFFAFILTLPREIVKDMEDLEGDNAYGRNSVPIVLGMKAAKGIVVSLYSISIIAIPIICFTHLHHTLSSIFLIGTVSFPLIWLCYKTIKAETANHYHKIQIVNKFVMLMGLLYLILLYFVIKGLI